MSTFLKDVAIGALGYVVGSTSKSNAVRETIDRIGSTVTLEDYIDKFARSRNIYVRDHYFAKELRRIAEKYDDPYFKED